MPKPKTSNPALAGMFDKLNPDDLTAEECRDLLANYSDQSIKPSHDAVFRIKFVLLVRALDRIMGAAQPLTARGKDFPGKSLLETAFASANRLCEAALEMPLKVRRSDRQRMSGNNTTRHHAGFNPENSIMAKAKTSSKKAEPQVEETVVDDGFDWDAAEAAVNDTLGDDFNYDPQSAIQPLNVKDLANGEYKFKITNAQLTFTEKEKKLIFKLTLFVVQGESCVNATVESPYFFTHEYSINKLGADLLVFGIPSDTWKDSQSFVRGVKANEKSLVGKTFIALKFQSENRRDGGFYDNLRVIALAGDQRAEPVGATKSAKKGKDGQPLPF